MEWQMFKFISVSGCPIGSETYLLSEVPITELLKTINILTYLNKLAC